MTNHAKHSPSSAHIWARCAGAGVLPQPPAPPPSIHMLQGTSAHMMLEKALENDIDPLTWTQVPVIEGKKRTPVAVTDEMRSAVATAVSEIEKILDSCKFPIYYVEQMLVMRQVSKTVFGTADLVIDDKTALWVIDYKNGAGVEVNADNNYQLALYGLGALAEFGRSDRPLHLGIIQPRARSGNTVKIWTIKDSKAFEDHWSEKFKKALYRIDQFSVLPPGQRYTSGDHCHWCPVKIVCPKVIEQTVLSMVADTAKMKKMGFDYLIEIFRNKTQITDILKTAEQYAHERVSRGDKIPGFKLVNGKSKRQWINPDQVEDLLHETDHDPETFLKYSLKSLAEIEKLMSKDWVDKHTIKSSAKTQLVFESDPRPEVSEINADDFEKF